MANVTQLSIDSRLVIDKDLRDVFGSAFEDFGMDGIRYVAAEAKRICESIEKEDSEGKLISI